MFVNVFVQQWNNSFQFCAIKLWMFMITLGQTVNWNNGYAHICQCESCAPPPPPSRLTQGILMEKGFVKSHPVISFRIPSQKIYISTNVRIMSEWWWKELLLSESPVWSDGLLSYTSSPQDSLWKVHYQQQMMVFVKTNGTSWCDHKQDMYMIHNVIIQHTCGHQAHTQNKYMFGY